MTTIADDHLAEVRRGDRFQFGRNWQRFLRNLTVSQIKLAENSLKSYLGSERLDGKTFLDIGSGSGLFSLAARRLGAKVRSFDYDPQSVACTEGLRELFHLDDANWVVEHGSVLDKAYLRSLGTFDIVYSWGVLHHTGAMWQAMKNVKPLVAMNGELFIALYNDQGEITDRWANIKRTYNALPRPLAFSYALGVIGIEEAKHLASHYRHGTVSDWLKTWTRYHEITARGMSRWHDWIDWVGGYPYERAGIEPVIDFFANDGFRLKKLFDCNSGYGCNEFVFRREAPPGTIIDTVIPGGRSMTRQFGHRVRPPFERRGGDWTCPIPPALCMTPNSRVFLFRDNTVVKELKILPGRRVSLGSSDTDLSELTSTTHHVVACSVETLTRPFASVRGYMWDKYLPHLSSLADRAGDDHRSSTFVFEDGRQLDQPHATHDSIAKWGLGRFSHWGGAVYFSSSNNKDPNTNGCIYQLFTAVVELPEGRSLVQSYGRQLGQVEMTAEGWTAVAEESYRRAGENEVFLFRNEELVGPAKIDDQGRVLVAAASEAESTVSTSQFRLVPGEMRALAPPFAHERGLMWGKVIPELADVADTVGDNRSCSFVFEDGRQLPDPHASHDAIADQGAGRFSHWESSIYLSTSDRSDPNTNGRSYILLTPRK